MKEKIKFLVAICSPLFSGILFCGGQSLPTANANHFTHFVGIDYFTNFTRTLNPEGEAVLISPPIQAEIAWNELILSWNADAPAGTFLRIEARAISGEHHTKFYTFGVWSPDNRVFPRTSVRGQKDPDGNVDTDTLLLTQSARAAQIRVTLGGTNGALPILKFLGASFANTKTPPAFRPSNRQAWGKIIATPEHSQHGYPGEKGWCSPTSLSMLLSHWAEVLQRPEMNLTVPIVATNVYDEGFAGTGNWPFNTAFAGSFSGMKSYVTRLDDLAEVEDWVNDGIPVILSARWDWLLPGRPIDNDGHLIVCVGFTKSGDVIINDPSTRFDLGETVRRVYQRQNVIRAWTKSHNAVYLVYPVGTKTPPNIYGHW